MRVVRPVLTSLLAGAALAVVAWALGMPLQPVLGSLLLVVVALTLWLLRALPAPNPLPWDRPGAHRQVLTADRRLSTLRWAVAGIQGGTWDKTVAPLLLDAVEHRLRAHHGIDLHEQPDEARSVLAPELRRLVDHPQSVPRNQAALRAVVSRIEEL